MKNRVQRKRCLLELQRPGFDPGKIQDIVNERAQRLGRQVELVNKIALTAIKRAAREQVREPDDGVERRADLVAHVGNECTLGLVGRLGLRLGALDRANVERHHEEPGHLSALAAVGQVVHLRVREAPRNGRMRVSTLKTGGFAAQRRLDHRLLEFVNWFVQGVAQMLPLDLTLTQTQPRKKGRIGEAIDLVAIPIADAAWNTVEDDVENALACDDSLRSLLDQFLELAAVAPEFGAEPLALRCVGAPPPRASIARASRQTGHEDRERCQCADHPGGVPPAAQLRVGGGAAHDHIKRIALQLAINVNAVHAVECGGRGEGVGLGAGLLDIAQLFRDFMPVGDMGCARGPMHKRQVGGSDEGGPLRTEFDR